MKLVLLVLTIILIILIIGCFICRRTITEKFGDILSTSPKYVSDPNKQFDDVVVYYNDLDGKIGYDTCIDKCNGFCVENGMTGSAFCYPLRPLEKTNIDKYVDNNKRLVFQNVE